MQSLHPMVLNIAMSHENNFIVLRNMKLQAGFKIRDGKSMGYRCTERSETVLQDGRRYIGRLLLGCNQEC